MKTCKDGINKREEIPRWKPEREVQLFYALDGRRPVGINRFFHMIFVQEEFNRLTGQEVSSDTIWKYLESMYDIDALNENEDLPFNNEQSDFVLPLEYLTSPTPTPTPTPPPPPSPTLTPTKSPSKSSK